MNFIRILVGFLALLSGVYFYVYQQQQVNLLETSTHFINQYFFFNSYLYRIPSTSKYILIDTLTKGSEGIILKKLKDLGIKEDEIALVYHTHFHDDHIGSTSGLSKVLKSKFWINPKDQDIIDKGELISMGKSTFKIFQLMREYLPKQPLLKIKSNIELNLILY